MRKTNRLVTVEEAWPVCSVGSEICAQVAIQAFDYLDAPPAKVTGADVPMPYAANLEKLALPTADQVVAAAKGVLLRAEDTYRVEHGSGLHVTIRDHAAAMIELRSRA